MGELQAVEKLLKKQIPVIGGAPWAADVVAAAPKPGANRGQRPARPQAGGRPQGAKPASAKPGAAKPAGGRMQEQQRPGQGKPQGNPSGGAQAPRRAGKGPRRAD
jgi:ATP-dependent RNA helicase RhlE